MELPLTALLLPDDDVLALVEHLLARTLERVPAHLDCRVAEILDLVNLQPSRGDATVHGCLPECADGLPAASYLTSRREQLGVLGVEAGEPSSIGLLEGVHEPFVCRF